MKNVLAVEGMVLVGLLLSVDRNELVVLRSLAGGCPVVKNSTTNWAKNVMSKMVDSTASTSAWSHDQVTRLLAAPKKTGLDLWRKVKPLLRKIES